MVSGTNDFMLKKPVALGLLYKYMQAHLYWLPLVTGSGVIVGGKPLIPAIKEETDAFMYMKEEYNASTDPKKELPADTAAGAALPEVDRTRPSVTSDVVLKNGFQMRIPRAVIRNSSEGSIVEMNDNFNYAGMLMGELLNTKIKNAAVGGARLTGDLTAQKFAPPAVWSDTALATPFKDLRNFARDFKNDIYRLTDTIGHENSYYELCDYVTDRESDQYKQERVYGLPTVNADSINIPAIGDFASFGTDITDGYLLGLDRNHPAMEYHYYNDPAYSQTLVNYEAMINGTPTNVQIRNLGIHFKTIVDEDNEDTIMKFWVEQKTIVKRKGGLLYLGGV
jgi:hypothetical protein